MVSRCFWISTDGAQKAKNRGRLEQILRPAYWQLRGRSPHLKEPCAGRDVENSCTFATGLPAVLSVPLKSLYLHSFDERNTAPDGTLIAVDVMVVMFSSGRSEFLIFDPGVVTLLE
jgi:hypothetical protein